MRIVKKHSRTQILPKGLLEDVVRIIQAGRGRVAAIFNKEHVAVCWSVGKRINQDILKGARAEYGKQIVATLSQQLTEKFGSGFSRYAISRMIKFSELFNNPQIVATLSQQLSWSHFIELLPIENALQRNFYCEMCRIERWNVATLRNKINGMLYERTALSKKPAKIIKHELKKLSTENQLTPDLVFRDPYFLEFLELHDTYSEKDLESAILRDMEKFILELGIGFSFVARQKRMTVDNTDYYLDLLFFNRRLKRLVAIELKLGNFSAGDKGQMELYLRWLEKHEMQEGEGHPLGLILCAGKSDDHVELLKLSSSGIRVSTYLTELPPKNILEQKLRGAIRTNKLLLSSKGMK